MRRMAERRCSSLLVSLRNPNLSERREVGVRVSGEGKRLVWFGAYGG
jgi:hypothetical protein